MNKQRFLRNFEALGSIGWDNESGLHRVAFTESFSEGRDFVATLMDKAGMDVRIDSLGNLFGRYKESGPKTATLLIGSHLDSVPGGGKYDGPLGVLAALEVAQSLHEREAAGLSAPCISVEVVGFNAEEGGEMGGTFGSRAICGDIKSLPPSDVLQKSGLSPEKIADAKLDLSCYRGYIELHIEQGPVLWDKKIPIGIPFAIVGITRYRITLKGQANHAGTTPMSERKDAMKEAVRLLSHWYDWLDSVQEKNFVCNVGTFTVTPGSASVIPGEVSFILELRSTEDSVVEKLAQRFRFILSSASLPASMDVMVTKPAVKLDASLQSLIRRTCREMNVATLDMPSGAGHDAASMAQHIPSAMIFVPSREGISHSPDENTPVADMIQGVEVLEKILKNMNDKECQ